MEPYPIIGLFRDSLVLRNAKALKNPYTANIAMLPHKPPKNAKPG